MSILHCPNRGDNAGAASSIQRVVATYHGKRHCVAEEARYWKVCGADGARVPYSMDGVSGSTDHVSPTRIACMVYATSITKSGCDRRWRTGADYHTSLPLMLVLTADDMLEGRRRTPRRRKRGRGRPSAASLAAARWGKEQRA